jgi:hypothetical protein
MKHQPYTLIKLPKNRNEFKSTRILTYERPANKVVHKQFNLGEWLSTQEIENIIQFFHYFH